MTKTELLLESLLDSLDWEDRVNSTGTEHERAIAAQKTKSMRKFAREALDATDTEKFLANAALGKAE